VPVSMPNVHTPLHIPSWKTAAWVTDMAPPSLPSPQCKASEGAPPIVHVFCQSEGETVGDIVGETAHVMQQIRDALKQYGDSVSLCDVFYTRVYLLSMSSFADVNMEYAKSFEVNPPSRCCIEVQGMARGRRVAIECCAISSASIKKRVLHVQSISSWSSSCIGPYSQATAVEGLVFLSGMIGLVPETMTIVEGGVVRQLQQIVSNMAPVLDAMDSSLANLLFCIVYYTTSDHLTLLERTFLPIVNGVSITVFVHVHALPRGAQIEIEATGAITDDPGHAASTLFSAVQPLRQLSIPSDSASSSSESEEGNLSPPTPYLCRLTPDRAWEGVLENSGIWKVRWKVKQHLTWTLAEVRCYVLESRDQHLATQGLVQSLCLGMLAAADNSKIHPTILASAARCFNATPIPSILLQNDFEVVLSQLHQGIFLSKPSVVAVISLGDDACACLCMFGMSLAPETPSNDD